MLSTSVIIPAKGCSSRLPRKNLAIWREKSLVQWSIEYALAEGWTPYVVSEDPEILDLATRLGSRTILEPPALLQEHAFEVLKFAATVLETNIVNLPTTSPLRRPGLIRQTVEMLGNYECVWTGFPLPGHFVRDRSGKIVNRPYRLDGSPPHSQEFSGNPQWIQGSCIMGYRYPDILGTMDSIFGCSGIIEISLEELFDIDYPEDLTKYPTFTSD